MKKQQETILESSQEFAGGSGTLKDPYLISNVQQLSNIRNHLDSYYKQVNDIYNTPEHDNFMFEPIGDFVRKDHTDNVAFTGALDGNGYKLISWGPIFELIGNKGEVKNLAIESTLCQNEIIISRFYDCNGSIARYNKGTIENCSVIKDQIFGSLYIGGLVGYNIGYIADCYFQGKVMGDNYVGGIAGYNSGFLTNNIARGFRSGDKCGGITGVNDGMIEDCIDGGINQGKVFIGGITGINFNNISRTYSYSSCRGQNYIGGLVGTNNGKVLDCLARGYISYNWQANRPSLSKHGSDNNLDQSKNSNVSSQKQLAGGLVGKNQKYIARSYSDCNIEGFSEPAGITFNSMEGESEVIDSYYNPEDKLDEKNNILENWDNADTAFLNDRKLPVIDAESNIKQKAIKRAKKVGDDYVYMW